MVRDAAQLMAHFHLLAEAPGGVARVRQLVLELAFRGKLTARAEQVSQAAPAQAADESLARRGRDASRQVIFGTVALSVGCSLRPHCPKDGRGQHS